MDSLRSLHTRVEIRLGAWRAGTVELAGSWPCPHREPTMGVLGQMHPLARTEIAKRMADQPTGELGLFFVSHNLGDAWNRDSRGWGRAERVSRALAAADRRGDLERVLRAAAAHFGIPIPDEPRPRPVAPLDNDRVRQLAFDGWRAKGEWPAVSVLQREAESRRELIDIDVISHHLDRRIGWVESQDMRLVLRVRGFADLAGARRYVSSFLRVVKLMYARYSSPGEEAPSISDLDLRDGLGFDERLVRRMYSLLKNEWFLLGGGQETADGTWKREVSSSIRHFRDVGSITDYLDAEERLSRPYVREAPSEERIPQQQNLEATKAIAGLEQLHPEVLRVAGGLAADGHYGEAVFAAFKAVELRVKDQSGVKRQLGAKLMGEAFSGSPPKIVLATTSTEMAEDEQEGFKLIFMGAMQAIRNLGAHDFPELDQRLAGDYLAFASLLFNRLDAAMRARPDGGTSPQGPGVE